MSNDKEKEYDTCPICAEERRIKTWITCSKCQFSCCRSCTKKFLLELTDVNPRCMSCKAQWDFEFVAENTDDGFHNKIYRERRAKIVMDRERSLLPATQPLVVIEKAKRDAKKELDEINKEIQMLQELLNQAYERKTKLRKMVYNEEKEEKKIVTRFIGHCPQKECKGYLDPQYLCGICKEKACRSCRQPKHDEEECDKDLVETVRLLAKDTKSCPNCGVPTYRISGCAQIWCTCCHSPWDWDTGKIEIGRIHNPHFYAWQREHGGAQREAGDVRCGGPVPEYILLGKIQKCGFQKKVVKWVMNAHRLAGHIRGVLIPRYTPEMAGEQTHQDLRVDYLLNSITEKEWLSKIKAREKKREKNNAICLVLQMFVDTIDDLIANIVATDPSDIPLILVQMKELRIYVTKNLEKISQRFQNKVPTIQGDWSMDDIGNKKVRNKTGFRPE